ncbi:hypothetical protein F5Y16DRAFT_106243 [Xylariaceae sp. FL0255]|nr:hypothetical protein F5Y16DRAFT_106243 [Xylariaceae sp. FL0255]
MSPYSMWSYPALACIALFSFLFSCPDRLACLLRLVMPPPTPVGLRCYSPQIFPPIPFAFGFICLPLPTIPTQSDHPFHYDSKCPCIESEATITTGSFATRCGEPESQIIVGHFAFETISIGQSPGQGISLLRRSSCHSKRKTNLVPGYLIDDMLLPS